MPLEALTALAPVAQALSELRCPPYPHYIRTSSSGVRGELRRPDESAAPPT